MDDKADDSHSARDKNLIPFLAADSTGMPRDLSDWQRDRKTSSNILSQAVQRTFVAIAAGRIKAH